ncbi:A/G-specific adenine glycosylase [Flavobacterium sp. MFBS3-15]|uniref:A/G-specific adenine glycosylase n=1 Tax=Flavobacterium sp. MFBS3-15 TaxID=2989816 RepID=UPI0022369FD5|nr:A/G-specific adenine glycosylase [Flavobacterium sp. MFBS3-15]MCW4468156.1 A/G-specific adenine glycosylase [Flavobacterium sp. MFBS3-15]
MGFSKSLIQWYLQNKRDLPWRKTTDPYRIWLSEIMLQQTRVAQGTPYFVKFTEAFPTVHDMASAPEEHILKLWQGLGYYSRARNLHATARQVAFEMGGTFPNSYAGLLKLKGVGDYTAAAIASISYGEPVPVVDGNVYRVLARYFGIQTDISSSGAKKQFTEVAASLLPKDDAATFNQAMMEFGALQCVPKNPDCSVCIFNKECAAFLTGRVSMLPVKLKKTKVTDRFFNYLIVKDAAGHTIVNKRTAKGIWHNLYEFPLIETEKEVSVDEMSMIIGRYFADEKPPRPSGASRHGGTGSPEEGKASPAQVAFAPKSITLLHPERILHKLSHQHLSIRFWEVEFGNVLSNAISIEEAMKYPFPIVIHNFMEKHWRV